MDNLIRRDTVFGKRANIVGNISADLVLESLGKIYIKSRNKALTLEEFITSFALGDPNVSTSKAIIVEGLEDLDITELKDGTFIYDKLSNILYIVIDGELIELINVAPEGTLYVKRTGDTMTGRLAIYVPDGPPLYVNSTKLVLNLNANYLNGYSGENFAKKPSDEWITGKWKFKSPTEFESNTLFSLDIIVNGSVGSSVFTSGFSGSGWRMDANTNTLTVDNLIVRKLMHVYELVVNKISATNGSLWITNAGKVKFAKKLNIYNLDFFNRNSSNYLEFYNTLEKGDYFIRLNYFGTFHPTAEEIQTPDGTVTLAGPEMYTVNCLKNSKLVRIDENLSLNSTNLVYTFDSDNVNKYSRFKLFDEDFKYDTVFPFITRPTYSTYKIKSIELKLAESLLILLKEELVELQKELSKLLEEKQLIDSQESGNSATIDAQISTKENEISVKESEISAKENEVNVVQSQIPQIASNIIYSKPFFKYYGAGDFYVVIFDTEQLPVFKPGDLLRCQKWTYNGIKYYDAIVCNIINNSECIIRLADSILDKKTTITYNSSLEAEYVTEWKDNINLSLYEQTSTFRPYQEPEETITNSESALEEHYKKNLLGMVEENDSLVQIGNIWDSLRLNAVYITSTDDAAPYMDVLSNCNRPDYSVIYYVPVYLKVKLNKQAKQGNFVGKDYLTDIPYTGDYYIQGDVSPSDILTNCDYTYFKHNNNYYMAKGKLSTNPAGVNGIPNDATIVYYLNTLPNKYTKLGEAQLSFYLLLENGGKILLESGNENLTGALTLEEELLKLLIVSTRVNKARLGNLDGILDETFPNNKQPYGYGLYGLNVFLTGEFYLNNGRSLVDVSQDAIEFAIVSAKAGDAALEILKRDLELADLLLKQDVYTKGDLFTAGMRIGLDSDGNPGIVLWGNKIIIATTKRELVGIDSPTALFANGMIKAKFILVSDIHSSMGFGNTIKITRIQDPNNPNNCYEQELQLGLNGEYYYIDDNGITKEPIYIYDGYDTYGWHLHADGSGYLALRNIEWTSNGKLTINSDFIINSGNGMYIYNDNGGLSTIINNQSFNTYTAYSNTNKNDIFYFRGDYNTGTMYDGDITGVSEVALLVSKSISFNTDLLYLTIPYNLTFGTSVVRLIGLLVQPIEFILRFSDSSNNYDTKITSQNLTGSITISSDIDRVLLFLIINNNNYYINGLLSLSYNFTVSLIGSNFMAITPGNTKLWVGEDGIKMSYTDNYEIKLANTGTFIKGPIKITLNTREVSLLSLLSVNSTLPVLSGNIALNYSSARAMIVNGHSDMNTAVILSIDPNNPIEPGTIFVFIPGVVPENGGPSLKMSISKLEHFKTGAIQDNVTLVFVKAAPITLMYRGDGLWKSLMEDDSNYGIE